MKRTVIVLEYNPAWPSYFANEAHKIRNLLQDEIVAIHHVGSTAVLGLAAKPVIDIIPTVIDILSVDQFTPALEQMGYEAKGEFGIPFRRYFKRQREEISYNVHFYEKDNPEVQRLLLFRDYLINHPAARDEYANLKRNLSLKYPDNVDAYCDGKSSFINDIDAKSGYEGFRLVQAATLEEWEAYHRIRKEEIFDLMGIEYDPNHPTLSDPRHFHFVFRKNTSIIGVVHIQLIDQERAAIRPIAIADRHKNQGYGSILLKIIERWISHAGRSIIQLHASQRAVSFYKRHGYHEMPFPDEPREPELKIDTVDMGKKLK